jgi:hypothetical protein
MRSKSAPRIREWVRRFGNGNFVACVKRPTYTVVPHLLRLRCEELQDGAWYSARHYVLDVACFALHLRVRGARITAVAP